MVRLAAVLVLGAATSAFGAIVVVNPGFEDGGGSLNGWSTWRASWGVNDIATFDTANKHSGAASARMQFNNGKGSFGIKQVVDVPTGIPLSFSCWVRATGTGSSRWAEVLVFNYAAPDGDIDSGSISAPFLAWKRDDWTGAAGVPGGKLPTVGTDSWEQVTKTLTSTTGKVTIAYKWGSSPTQVSSSLRIDDVVLTPEPATLLLLAVPALLIRRRRA